MSQGGGPRRLILPGEPEFGGSGKGEFFAPFRPPSDLGDLASETPAEMLSKLRERRGVWYDLAKYIPILQRSGYTIPQIDAETGINGVTQNNWVVGSQVLDSLREVGLSSAGISFFESGNQDILYEIRILNNNQRKQAAEYVIEQGLGAPGARDVSRAIKDHERRRGSRDRQQFSSHPGDCLAYQYYRQAIEASRWDREDLIKRGLDAAVTNEARVMLNKLLVADESGADSASTSGPWIDLVPFMPFEQSVLAAPVLGSLESVTEEAVVSAVPATTGGPFGIFTVPQGGDWVAFPEWRALAGGQDLVAIYVADGLTLGSLTRLGELSKKKKKDQDDNSLLLVVARAGFEVDADSCFVVSNDGGGVQVVGGDVAPSAGRILGKVLLAVRPAEEETPEDENVDYDD